MLQPSPACKACFSKGLTGSVFVLLLTKTFKSMNKPKPIQEILIAFMKITLTQLLLAAFFSVFAYGFETKGQEVLDRKISIRVQNETIKSVLSKIEKKASLKFTYQPHIIRRVKNISLDYREIKISQLLDQIFSVGVNYEAVGNQIILSPNEQLADSISYLADIDLSVKVTGVITDETNQPLPGVNVLEKGTSNGATTDIDGRFSLSVEGSSSILSISFIGYETQEILVGNRTEFNVQLATDVRSLQEVVVVGYGEIKKSDITGAVASIKSEELNAYPATNVMQSLSGRATGVYISQNNGSPGSPISVRIRGTNSIQGSNEPLYVVDGFPYSGNPTLLNNADIESIEVLKDASATAIYGSRGANGVVLITTKRGKSGKVKVSYDGYVGVQTVRKKIDLMNAKEYAQFYNEQAANEAKAPHFTQAEIDAMGEGTDWQDVALRSAPIQNHSLSLTGGGENTRYAISLSNFNQGGIIIGSNYVRNSIRTNLTTDINSKLKFDLSSMLSRVDSDRKNSDKGNRGSSLISAMLSGYPTIGTHNPDGTYTNLSAAYGWGSNAIVNPLNWIEQENDKITSNKVLTNAALSYTPIKGLTFKISGGIESTDDRTDYYQTKKFINSTGIASISTFRGTSLLNENTVSYNKQAGKHMISAVAGFTIQNYVSSGLNASGNGFVSDTQESFDIGAAANQGVPSSSYSKWTLLSYLARVNYTFNDKYLLTASFRADGSSRYSENQKWGTFPSASIAWRLSEEEFIKNISVISDLKVRAGYGESGSTAISPYQTLNQLASGKVVFGDALYTSYAPGTRLAGPLKWETTAQTDVGIDVGLFSNRILFTADYYVKNTRDLLNNVTLPASLGYLTTIRNVGEMQNKGFEFAVNAKILTGDFKWDVSANTSFNKNKIVKLYDGLDVLGGVINISVVGDNINILREGESVGSFYGYVENGYDANGYVTYTDFSGSGTRDALDKRIIGNPNPNMVYGFNSTMSYKNFELNVFIQGTQGNDIFNLSAVNQTNDYGQALNMPREVLYNHWTPETPNAKYPVIKTNSQPQISDRFVEDGSYMRFKNIQLTYTLPVAGLNINWLSNAQVYVSGQNLITFTKYSWYDPEVNSYGSSNSIQLGIDHYSYPAAKTYTVGLRLGF